jgi:DNA-binding GntR family transcriptional regulator
MVRVSTTESQTKEFWGRYKAVTRRQTHKYLQLCQALMNAIDDGFWTAGDKLPPEGELARLTPFSLGTAQKAYAELVAAGSVERRAGAGSFVLRTPKLLDTPWHFRFRPDANSEFRPVFPRLLKISRHSGTGVWSSFLTRSSKVTRISRSVRIGSEFTLFAEFYIDAGYYDQAMAGRGKLEGINLRKELNLQVKHMTNDVRVERLAREECPALKLKEDAHVMVISSQAHAQNPAANYLQRVIVPPTPEWLHFTDSRPGAPSI